MGTSNFYNKNASNVYAVLMGETIYKCNVCNEYEHEEIKKCGCGSEDIEEDCRYPDEWEYECFKEDLISMLLELKEKGYYVREGGNVSSNLRSFEGTAIATISAYKTYLNVEVEIQLTAIIRSGYYDGANLDWEITYFADGYENDDIISEWEYQANKEFNIGLVKMNNWNVKKWLENNRDGLICDVEEIYEKMSNPLKVVGRFSNGETIYERA